MWMYNIVVLLGNRQPVPLHCSHSDNFREIGMLWDYFVLCKVETRSGPLRLEKSAPPHCMHW